jgi:flavin-dependent dehydrogenase
MKVDVAIVGGGPAGCSAALALRAKDHSVAVIDLPSPRAKCTEMAGPALPNRLQRLNAAETLSAFDPCFGISSNWGRTEAAIKPSILDPFGHAWFIHRERFDACLKLAALSMGAIWIEGKARSFDFNKQSVSIETTGHARVQAKWVMLATGSPCWAARVTHQNCSTVDNLIAYWAYLPVRHEERLLFVEAADHGWWYVCPRADKDLLACFVTDSASSITGIIPFDVQIFSNGSAAKRSRRQSALFLVGLLHCHDRPEHDGLRSAMQRQSWIPSEAQGCCSRSTLPGAAHWPSATRCAAMFPV